MLRYIARRLLGMVALLVVISMVTFVLFFAVPVSPAALSCGKACTPTLIASIERKMGIDKPLYEQYVVFVKGIFTGREFGEGTAIQSCDAPCLGYSFKEERPVTEMLVERFPVTFSLAIGAFVIWLVVGVTVGIISALKRGSLLDRSFMIVALAGVSLPSFFTGLMILTFLVIRWGLFPTPQYTPFTDNPFTWAQNLILPGSRWRCCSRRSTRD
jgi:peptide/nickel transport system permease protein